MALTVNFMGITDAVSMASITTHEYPLVKGILLSDTLTNGVDRVPLNPVPLNPVWLQDILCGLLDFLGGGGLAGVPIGVGRGGDLNVQADHVVFTRNDHDGASIGVDGAFCLYIILLDHAVEFRLRFRLKNLTSMSGKLVRTTPSITPQT